jgi:aspartyl-tRNA(Asn)/glutamyl-tRNA(Gln) amidotransferase subunit A
MIETMSISDLINGYRNKEFSPTEITMEQLKRIDEVNKTVNAFITVSHEQALAQARIAEKNWLNGVQLNVLQGVPISFKDLIFTKGIKTTSGSYIFKDFIPKEDASIVNKITRASAINLGKTNLHEFAFGITSNNPFYGAVKNPWKLDHIPGGSSGGSAAAVAAGLGFASIGTDTGGSIRIPASACGIVGLKPTRQKIKTNGVQGISWTLDHVGPMTQNITDLAIVMYGLTDRLYLEHCQTDIKGMRIGVSTKYFTEYLEPEIRTSYQKALQKLENLGAILMEIGLPSVQEASEQVFPIALVEGAYTHEKNLIGKLNQFGEDVKTHLQRGKTISAVNYLKALHWQKIATSEVDEVLMDVDIIATPTLPASPKPIHTESIEIDGLEEDIFTSLTRFTRLFSLTGHPALSLPMGLTDDGLPIGLQLVSKYNYESLLIRAGFAFEQAYLQDFYDKRSAVAKNL